MKKGVLARIQVGDLWGDVLEKIHREDLFRSEEEYTGGLELQPHVTVLWGLEPTVHDDLLIRILESVQDLEVTFGEVNAFHQDEYDVLKYEVESEVLSELHDVLLHFPNSYEFDDFNPHMTIAYLKEGFSDRYEDTEFPDLGTRKVSRFDISGPGDHSCCIRIL